MTRTVGMPIDTAATSSSRIAIHARPMRESRSRKLTNRTTSASPSAVQYHGLKFNDVKRSTSGRSILSTGLMPERPLVRLKLPIPKTPSSELIAMRPMISPNASVTIAM